MSDHQTDRPGDAAAEPIAWVRGGCRIMRGAQGDVLRYRCADGSVGRSPLSERIPGAALVAAGWAPCYAADLAAEAADESEA